MNVRRTGTAAALIGVGVVAGLILSWQVEFGGTRAGQSQAFADNTSSAPLPVIESPFVSVAQRVVPGVVAIATRGSSEDVSAEDMRRFHPWGDLFDDLFPNDPRGEAPRTPNRRPSGAGSGFLLDHDGYILTNNHVVSKADQVTVTLGDGVELDAEVIGLDPATDVALIKVDPKDHDGPLPALDIGDSDTIRVGDWAIAVGNPFGQLAGSLTVGVISATGRQDLNIMGGTPAYQNFIQTDASINFGNSGGPLVNARGEVIGMNTAINAAGQGIGFAIPINMAARIADQLKTEGRVVRGYLGILPQALTPELAESLDLADTDGILIGQVIEDTPAARAGLERGDVIVKMNGKKLSSDVNAFRLAVADQPVGDEMRLEVIREGKSKRIDVKLEERPENVVAGFRPGGDESAELWAGLGVDDADSRRAQRLIDDPQAEGVVVVVVEPDSPADDAGIRVGDVVKEIGNVEISSMRDYKRAVDKYSEKKAVAVLLKRGEQTLYVGLKP
ncbi:MAG: Do family serine endopeptidase [bacterium]